MRRVIESLIFAAEVTICCVVAIAILMGIGYGLKRLNILIVGDTPYIVLAMAVEIIFTYLFISRMIETKR